MKSQEISPIKKKTRSKKSGSALMTAFMILMIIAIAGSSYVAASMTSIQISNRQSFDIQTTHLAEGGAQDLMLGLWLDFQTNQTFTDMDSDCQSATPANPVYPVSGNIPSVGNYSAAVVGYTKVNQYTRQLVLRTVGWEDLNGNGVLDSNEPQKVLDLTVTYELQRSGVFDYTYFVNNYGWMDGFQPSWLYVQGDMRANGDFNITNGSPTVNGSIIATQNQGLVPAAVGAVNGAAVKESDATYQAGASSQPSWRQDYNAAVDGSVGSANYMANLGLIFESVGSIVNNQFSGAILADSTGARAWDLESEGGTPTFTQLSSTPTSQLIMPDLNDISSYETLSQTWTDPLQTYNDGTTNPLYGTGAYLETWNTATNSYKTITTDGVVTGSAAIIGTAAHPIKIHGPVTFTQDAVITGNVSGQGTIYTGRNINIVGSVLYTNPPNFTTGSGTAAVAANQKADMLGMAANGSVIMGDTSQFSNPYPLAYMTPPFTVGRYDAYGNYIPAFDATQVELHGIQEIPEHAWRCLHS